MQRIGNLRYHLYWELDKCVFPYICVSLCIPIRKYSDRFYPFLSGAKVANVLGGDKWTPQNVVKMWFVVFFENVVCCSCIELNS